MTSMSSAMNKQLYIYNINCIYFCPKQAHQNFSVKSERQKLSKGVKVDSTTGLHNLIQSNVYGLTKQREEFIVRNY